MSHKIIYLGIPESRLDGDTSIENIDDIVEDIMAQYVEGTATDWAKLDYFGIGGRWSGALATKKGSPSAYESDSGMPYDLIEQYNSIINNGQNGPYIAGTEEYTPVNGALKKDIDLTAVFHLFEYARYIMIKNVFNGENPIPDSLEIIDDCMYLKDDHTLFAKKSETYEEWLKSFGEPITSFLPPDAYIDLDGKWNDTNEIMNNWSTEKMVDLMADGTCDETAENEFQSSFQAFLDSLDDEDYILVIDGHSFP